MDYTDKAAVSSALRAHGVQVVISAIAFIALNGQTPLADAAKDAGVELFVPSEFGMPTEGGKEGHMVIKSQFAGERGRDSKDSAMNVSVCRLSKIDRAAVHTFICMYT